MHTEYTVAGRGDSDGFSLPDARWEMSGRFDCIVLPLDTEFPNQHFVRRAGLCHAQIHSP